MPLTKTVLHYPKISDANFLAAKPAISGVRVCVCVKSPCFWCDDVLLDAGEITSGSTCRVDRPSARVPQARLRRPPLHHLPAGAIRQCATATALRRPHSSGPKHAPRTHLHKIQQHTWDLRQTIDVSCYTDTTADGPWRQTPTQCLYIELRRHTRTCSLLSCNERHFPRQN